jgi:hypothetical protein
MKVMQFDGTPASGDGSPRGQAEGDDQPAMRAAPNVTEEDEQNEEPPEEPGYGHGV